MKRLLQIIFITILALIILAAVVMIFPAYHKSSSLQSQNIETKQKLIDSQQIYLQLRQKLNNINNRTEEIEKIAREKFNLCKDSETVYKFKSDTDEETLNK